MTQNKIKPFLDAVKQDSSLMHKLKAAKDVESVVSVANTAGFSFTVDDLSLSLEGIDESELEEGVGYFTAVSCDLNSRFKSSCCRSYDSK